jgi:hypothetical protein
MLHDIHLRKVLADDYIRGLSTVRPVPAEPEAPTEARGAGAKGTHGGDRLSPPYHLRSSRA